MRITAQILLSADGNSDGDSLEFKQEPGVRLTPFSLTQLLKSRCNLGEFGVK